MAPKHHHTPLSGGDRKALSKELSKVAGDDAHFCRSGALVKR
jgi:hypothetical protein